MISRSQEACLCAQVAEVIFPAAESTLVELLRLRSLEAREVTVRTLSAQGESVDSSVAAIPSDLLVPPTPHPRTAPKSKPLASAGAPETKEEHLGPHLKRDESWEQTRSVSPVHGHMLEPPNFHGPLQGRRSPSPNRILPQPQGTPVPNTVAKAMAREAAQRVAESNRVKANFFLRLFLVWFVHCDTSHQRFFHPFLQGAGNHSQTLRIHSLRRSSVLKFWACKALLCLLSWIHREFYVFALLSATFSHVCSCFSFQLLLELPAGALPRDTPGLDTTVTHGCCTDSDLC